MVLLWAGFLFNCTASPQFRENSVFGESFGRASSLEVPRNVSAESYKTLAHDQEIAMPPSTLSSVIRRQFGFAIVTSCKFALSTA